MTEFLMVLAIIALAIGVTFAVKSYRDTHADTFSGRPDDPRIGARSHAQNPYSGWCLRCKTSWMMVEVHSTHYATGRGCFPLCALCWGELTPETRLPYYRELWESWGPRANTTWEPIERAVLAETAA